MMSNPKSKILPSVLSTLVVVMLFHCVDAFAPMLQGDVNIFGANVIGAVAGIVTVFGVCIAKRRSIFSIGLNFNIYEILSGLLKSLIIAAVPVGTLAAIKAVVSSGNLFALPNSPDEMSVVKAVTFAGACAVTAFSRELVFRGFVIRTMRPNYPFFDANILQASLSVLMPLFLIARNLLYGNYNFLQGFQKLNFVVFAAVVTLICEFVASIKRGLMARVTGNIWITVFENFIFMFFGGCLIIGEPVIKSYSTFIYLLIANLISLAIALVYYKNQKSRNQKRRERRQLEAEKRRAQNYENEIDNPDLQNISEKSVEEIMNEYNESRISAVGRHVKSTEPEKDENLMDFSEIRQASDE